MFIDKKEYNKFFAIRNSFFIDKIFSNLLGLTSNNFDNCGSASMAVNMPDATAVNWAPCSTPI